MVVVLERRNGRCRLQDHDDNDDEMLNPTYSLCMQWLEQKISAGETVFSVWSVISSCSFPASSVGTSVWWHRRSYHSSKIQDLTANAEYKLKVHATKATAGF